MDFDYYFYTWPLLFLSYMSISYTHLERSKVQLSKINIENHMSVSHVCSKIQVLSIGIKLVCNSLGKYVLRRSTMKKKLTQKPPFIAVMAVLATMSFGDFITPKAHAAIDVTQIQAENMSYSEEEIAAIEECIDDPSNYMSIADEAPVQVPVKTQVAQVEKPSSFPSVNSIVAQAVKETKSEEEGKSSSGKAQTATLKISSSNNEEDAKQQDKSSPSKPKVAEGAKTDISTFLENITEKIKNIYAQVSKMDLQEVLSDENIQKYKDKLEENSNQTEEVKTQLAKVDTEKVEKQVETGTENEEKVETAKSELESLTKLIEDKKAELEKLQEESNNTLANNQDQSQDQSEVETDEEEDNEALEEAWREADHYKAIACEYQEEVDGLEEKVEKLQETTAKQIQMMQQLQLMSAGLQNPGITFNPNIGAAGTQMALLQSYMLGQQMMSLQNTLNPLSLLTNPLAMQSALFRGLGGHNQIYNVSGNYYGSQNTQPLVYAPMPQQMMPQQMMPQQQMQPLQIPLGGQSFTQGINGSMRPMVNFN